MNLALLLAVLLILSPHAALAMSSAQCLSQHPLICNMMPTPGNRANGRVVFSPILFRNRCLVAITARLQAVPQGMHGFHIHTYGDLSQRNGSSAGGHFANPAGTDVLHGFPSFPRSKRHWGDFGNIVADADGVARFRAVDRIIKLRGIVGRGMIVHELPDMGPMFQPTGGAGDRIAACVIGFANPELL